jgi:hypothetical protein
VSIGSPFRLAQARALEQVIERAPFNGGLRLSQERYRHLSAHGLDRRAVVVAVDQLVAEKRAEVRVVQGLVEVRLTP